MYETDDIQKLVESDGIKVKKVAAANAASDEVTPGRKVLFHAALSKQRSNNKEKPQEQEVFATTTTTTFWVLLLLAFVLG